MKRPAALVVTAILLGVAIYVGRGGSRPGEAAASPTACLERMFLAAEQGDVEAYLACFTGQQRKRLLTELDAQGTAGFATSLKEAVRTLKGRAISGSGAAAADRATLTVERIYSRHAERQSYDFVHEAAGWRIESVGPVEEFQPPIPYGTPVIDLSK